jgi:hypothetical protein
MGSMRSMGSMGSIGSIELLTEFYEVREVWCCITYRRSRLIPKCGAEVSDGGNTHEFLKVA